MTEQSIEIWEHNLIEELEHDLALLKQGSILTVADRLKRVSIKLDRANLGKNIRELQGEY